MRIDFITIGKDLDSISASYDNLENKYIIYEDKFRRKWKLIPVNNPAIESPFIIKPLGREEK